jgi:hypothetical protein
MQREAATWLVYGRYITFCSADVHCCIARGGSKLSVMLLLLRMLRMLLDLCDMLCILAWSLHWPV